MVRTLMKGTVLEGLDEHLVVPEAVSQTFLECLQFFPGDVLQRERFARRSSRETPGESLDHVWRPGHASVNRL
jgi:hypothetical protein